MARTAAQYRELLKSFLPPGKIWTRSPNSVLHKILWGFGEELARIEARVDDLYNEKDVTTADELLEEHEKDYGLPDEGDSIATTDALRREELESSLLKLSQQFQQYYIDIASALGYDIEIEEFSPFWAGVRTSIDRCGDQNNIFFWMVWIDLESVEYSSEVNIKKLKNKIEATSPAHTLPLFEFQGAEFSRAFGRGFNSIPHFDNSWHQFDFSPDFSNAFGNNVDYDGENYIGAFGQAFSIDFDRYSGGAFDDSFGLGFSRQH